MDKRISSSAAMRTAWNFHSAGQLVFGRGSCRAARQHCSPAASSARLFRRDRSAAGRCGPGRASRRAAPRVGHRGRAVHGRRAGAGDRHGCCSGRGGAAVSARTACSAWAAAATWTWPRSPPCCWRTAASRAITSATTTSPGRCCRSSACRRRPAPAAKSRTRPCSPTRPTTSRSARSASYLRPALAVVDPPLTDACPRQVTADSGIDALTHAIEAYTAVDIDQLDAARRRAGRLPGPPSAGRLPGRKGHRADRPAPGDGRRTTATTRRPATAWPWPRRSPAWRFRTAAWRWSTRWSIRSAARCTVSHGAGNGLLLPFVMRYNLPVRTGRLCQDRRAARRRRRGLAEAAAAERAIAAVERIRAPIGIPSASATSASSASSCRSSPKKPSPSNA